MLKIEEKSVFFLKTLERLSFFVYNTNIVRKLKGEMKKWINFLN